MVFMHSVSVDPRGNDGSGPPRVRSVWDEATGTVVQRRCNHDTGPAGKTRSPRLPPRDAGRAVGGFRAWAERSGRRANSLPTVLLSVALVNRVQDRRPACASSRRADRPPNAAPVRVRVTRRWTIRLLPLSLAVIRSVSSALLREPSNARARAVSLIVSFIVPAARSLPLARPTVRGAVALMWSRLAVSRSSSRRASSLHAAEHLIPTPRPLRRSVRRLCPAASLSESFGALDAGERGGAVTTAGGGTVTSGGGVVAGGTVTTGGGVTGSDCQSGDSSFEGSVVSGC